MIPIRLELKNFMSYGEDVPALDLSGMHTLCLSGDNGNGKSALLDAMTWALWGESRAGKNKHDELVRLGADEMSVTLTFAMDGQTYRVLRKRSKRASGNQWELQQETPDQGLGTGWRALSGNNAGETEKAIQKLLRMSYDTFLNSAYLRQGQADQFVKQTPGKRKEILADILDLSRYDQLEQKAKDKARDAQAEAVDLERTLHVLDAELSGEAGHREALAGLQASLRELTAQGDALRAEMFTVRDRQKELEGCRQLAETLQAQIAAYDRELAELARDLAAQQAEADQCLALLARRDAICHDYERLLAARARLETLEEQVTQWNRGQQALAAAEKEWLTAQNEMRLRTDRAAREHEEAVGSVKELPRLRQERETVAARVAQNDAQERELQTARAAMMDAQAAYLTLEQENARLSEQARAWQERLDALSRQQGTCQVCNAPLSVSRLAAVRAEYQAALDECAARRNAVRADGKQVKTTIAEWDARCRTLQAESAHARAHQMRLGQIEELLLQMETRAVDVPKLAAHLAEVSDLLHSERFAPELAARLDKIRRGLSRYAQAETEYAAVKAEAALLLPAERQHIELQRAETALRDIQARLARTQQMTAQRAESRAALESQRAGLADTAGELDTLNARANELRTQEAARRSDAGRVEREIGSREEALTRCDTLRGQRQEKDAALSAARTQHEVHDQLARAFGKKGVQALIIDNAIPELQQEANRLLERLTDGDMSLFFDTLREAKGKGNSPIETLDIKVSDSLGTRPLEMYSGGEGFRAAFALRLALSKLLARRAGARLQTLIIDEGFGTQDGKGREKLVDALHVIGSDFERIIVITHIDELKDAFAARIEVTKTPAGSQITVMEGASG